MIKLRRLSSFKDQEFEERLAAVNEIRSNYQWATVAYDSRRSDTVWMIRYPLGDWFGFVCAELMNQDLGGDDRMYIYVHDLLLDPDRQRQGIGSAVLRHLLKKAWT